MIGIIAATTMNGVIGLDGKIPFNYPEDMAHFKKTTLNSIVVMGRKTLDSIGRPLPKRQNILISSKASSYVGIETFDSIPDVINCYSKDERDIWFIGGARIYEEAMKYADKILLTITPDYEYSEGAIRFPWINPIIFNFNNITKSDNSQLLFCEYNRI
jgi:dihydrofolate reductase